MLLSAVSVLIVAQSSSKIPEGLMNNPVYADTHYSGTYHYIIIIISDFFTYLWYLFVMRIYLFQY